MRARADRGGMSESSGDGIWKVVTAFLLGVSVDQPCVGIDVRLSSDLSWPLESSTTKPFYLGIGPAMMFASRQRRHVGSAEGYDTNGTRHKHERRAHRIVSTVSALLTLATLILFLLVGLGAPIIKVCVYVTHKGVALTVRAEHLAAHAKGQAVQPNHRYLRRNSDSLRDLGLLCRWVGSLGTAASPTLTLIPSENGSRLCVGPNLGYSLSEPINIAGVLNEPALTNAVEKGLTVILVLHPVCAALALILFPVCLIQRHAASIAALVVAITLAIVGSVSLAVDLALTIIAHDRVPAMTNGMCLFPFCSDTYS
jgi:hypothetical protein